MKTYIPQEKINYSHKTTVVEIRRRDAGNWDAVFVGMDDDGGDIHRIINSTTYADIADNPLYTVRIIAGL